MLLREDILINKITIVGAGYVGMSLGTLLGQKYEVTIIDNDIKRVDAINSGISTVEDPMIQQYISEKKIDISASSNIETGIIKSDIVILALPTNFDKKSNSLNTRIIEEVIGHISKIDGNIPIIIKSTIPSGFSDKVNKEFSNEIIFSPEFLREGNALKDNLYPSRIIMGSQSLVAKELANIFKSLALNSPEVFLMNNEEAEAVKLFANSYLATRISFFNELDTYCLSKNLDSRLVIKGVSSDKRIGDQYNNPSFGYGGYCLPKDTKQLLNSFGDIPQNIFTSIIESNKTRKNFIFDEIMKLKPKSIGIYRITMKSGSDNIRESAIVDVLKKLEKTKIKIYLYEPLIIEDSFMNFPVYKNINRFLKESDLIVTNRQDENLDNFSGKIFTRDIFGIN